ncbi:MAG: CcmD family protein [Balneolales bacterium]
MINSIIIIVIAFLNYALELFPLDQQYEQYEGVEKAEGLVGLMSSNDLILIVLGVSLIIWFTLLAFMIKVDRKVTKLEQKHESDLHTS